MQKTIRCTPAMAAGITKHMMETRFSKQPSFKNLPYDGPIENVAGRLVVFPSESEIYVSGSCVRIAQNLYLTCRHVITDYIEKFGHQKDKIMWECWVSHIFPGPEYGIWQMDRVWISAHSDLAVFHTAPYNDVAASLTNAPCVMLDLLPPALGERVSAFGYHSAKGNVVIDHTGMRHISVNAFGAASVGEVVEVHHERRDSSRLNFPCYQVNARFDGGMSGGPVFSDQGRLCGLVCSSLAADENYPDHISYVATLWPVMALSIDLGLEGNPVTGHYPLLELAKRNIISASRWERIRIVENQGVITVGLTPV